MTILFLFLNITPYHQFVNTDFFIYAFSQRIRQIIAGSLLFPVLFIVSLENLFFLSSDWHLLSLSAQIQYKEIISIKRQNSEPLQVSKICNSQVLNIYNVSAQL